MEKLRETGVEAADFQAFIDSAAQLNLIRQTDPSLACVAPGLLSRTFVQDFRSTPRFPNTEPPVLR